MKKPRGVPRLCDALAQAVARGLVVRYGRCTGEWLVSVRGGRVTRVTARRRDAPARLLTLLRRCA